MTKQSFDPRFLLRVASQFLPANQIKSIGAYGHGAINDSYLVVSATGSFLLQRINTEYFTQPPKLLDNFQTISGVRQGLPGLSAISCRNSNQLWHQDDQGGFWRMYVFFENTYSCRRINNAYQAYEIAKAYGQYLVGLSSLSLDSLATVIDDFHHPQQRYRQLTLAATEDQFNRANDCLAELAFVTSKQDEIIYFAELMANGELPQRLTHNDTGIDNVLLNCSNNAAVAVIDWDTTMPGFSVFDFGDLFRSALGPEFNEPISPLQCFEALFKGYLAGTGQLLEPVEIMHFPAASQIIALELGMRYLTDYLTGDRVFGYIDAASLLRARKSFRRYQIMRHHNDQFMTIIDEALLANIG